MTELLLFLFVMAFISVLELKRMRRLSMKKEIVCYLICITAIAVFAMLYFPTPTRTSPLGLLRRLPLGSHA
ncbi:MAG: hypothetical protein LBO63_05110 [Oscillospiraceae bacterium]|jgi:hypothetical protein|nr:hypothetical protein [Oscillospiraceae bacterium]